MGNIRLGLIIFVLILEFFSFSTLPINTSREDNNKYYHYDNYGLDIYFLDSGEFNCV